MTAAHPPCTAETPRCEFWTWDKDYLRPACCTAHLRQLLAFTEDLLTRYRIFHFLDYGSLLGAVRSQALIAWDEDADFSCLSSDLDKVLGLENEVAKAGFWMDSREAPYVIPICRSRVNQAHADLWFQRVENGFAYTFSPLFAERFRFPIRYLEDLGSVVLEGTSHPAPSPVEQFLAEHRYGPDFMTPRRVSGNLAWISGAMLTKSVEETLETLRAVDYRIERLRAQGKSGHNSSAWRPGILPTWLARAAERVPGSLLRLHRAAWKIRQRMTGEQQNVLLDVRYELHRRQAVLRLLEGKARGHRL